MSEQKIIPVILCGGSGTRLWPASRESHPKQFLTLSGDYSLLQNTVLRGLRACAADRRDVVIVTLSAMADLAVEQVSEVAGDAAIHVLSEPSARNTAAAVAFAADYVAATFGDEALMWVLPADHHIGDETALSMALLPAADAARAGQLVTFGINPTRPDTGYGYILRGDAAGGRTFPVREFVEKPDLKTAQAYLEGGLHLWNSGMFLFTAAAVIEQFAAHAPEILETLRRSTALDPRRPSADLYAAIASVPFDKAIMEKAANVAVVPCDPKWSDVGSWESLWEIRSRDHNDNAIEGRAACVKARGCLVQGQERLIAIAGLDNIIVIETDDAVLIGDKSDSASLKELVTALKKSGASEVLDAPRQPGQAWTMNKRIDAGADPLQARELNIPAGASLSLPAGENWTLLTIMRGAAAISFEGVERLLAPMESIRPSENETVIRNIGASELVIMGVRESVAEGVYFGAANDTRRVA